MLFCIISSMFLTCFYFFRSSKIQDKILSCNMLGIQSIGLSILWSWSKDISYGLDIGLIYASISFLSLLGFFDYFNKNSSKR